jgi:hypothetical protein
VSRNQAERRRPAWRAQLSFLIALIVVGVVLAFVWRLLTPATGKLGDDQEAAAAVDGTLALLGVIVGASCGVFVLSRPGREPVLRTVTAVVGSLIGAVVSWKLGDQLGKPALRATGAAFVWPMATSAAILIGSLLPWTSNRLQSAPAAPSPDPFWSDPPEAPTPLIPGSTLPQQPGYPQWPHSP